MIINTLLIDWFLEVNKEHILDGVRDFKYNDWWGGPVESAFDFYKDKQEYFSHAIEMQKNGTTHVSDWFSEFECPIKERTIEEMMHLMAQLRDGHISYSKLFKEPKFKK